MKTSAATPAQPFFAVRTRLHPGLVAAVVLSAAVIVVLSSAVAWDGGVPDWEAEPLRWINGWPDWFEPGMWVLQQVGVFMAPVVAGAILVWLTKKWWYIIPFALVLPSKLGIEKAIVKQLVDRQRPYVSVGPEIKVRGPNFEGLSFPSGHATTAFALAVLLTAFVPPKWRFVPLGWAVIVGIARIYYGEHNVLDVVTGAALGTAFATVLWFVFLNREVPKETTW